MSVTVKNNAGLYGFFVLALALALAFFQPWSHPIDSICRKPARDLAPANETECRIDELFELVEDSQTVDALIQFGRPFPGN